MGWQIAKTKSESPGMFDTGHGRKRSFNHKNAGAVLLHDSFHYLPLPWELGVVTAASSAPGVM